MIGLSMKTKYQLFTIQVMEYKIKHCLIELQGEVNIPGGNMIFDFNINYQRSLNLGNFLSEVESKPLLKVGVIGDSIMSKVYGGGNYSEPTGEKPPRGGYNTIPRRLYNHIVKKFSKPNFRRIDHNDWTRSILSGADDFTEITGDEILKPHWTNETAGTRYAYTQFPNSYAEITIPDGFENCAIILHRDDNEFNQDYDEISISINGSWVDEINTFKPKLDVNDYGNPFYTKSYLGLEPGNNIIRITKSNSNKTFTLWGIMYWTGQSMILYNHGMGAYSMELYYNSTHDSVVENDYDVIFFQLPGMNEAGKLKTLDETQLYLEKFIKLLDLKDVLYFSTHPMGRNESGINYYTDFVDPTLKDIYIRCKDVILDNTKPYLDVFEMFEKLIIEGGGSLLSGEGGLDYTTDGQHPNTVCAELFSKYIIDKAIGDKL